MTISFIIPIYNSEKYIKRCIDSILKQRGVNIEVILINDGSTDDSEKICYQYCERYKNIRYVKILNSGVSNARNVGIKNAQGDWICFVDADDYLLENSLERVYDERENY